MLYFSSKYLKYKTIIKYMNSLINGIKIFKHSINVKLNGWKKYRGSSEEICRQIINDCWNNNYFQTSIGHFDDFWTRDFAWCCESLIKLGYENKVRKTLLFALNNFKNNNKITTTVTKQGKCFDFPNYSVDSLPYILHSLLITDKILIIENSEFLNHQINLFFDKVVDKETGLAINKHFSSIRDHYIRNSCCYDNCMVGMLAEDLKKIKEINNPLKDYNYKKLIKENFWHDNYFAEHKNSSITSGDSLIFPFWTGLFKSRKMFNNCVEKIKELNLDNPLPLKYSNNNKGKKVFASVFAPNYEGTAIWAHLGMIYLQLLKKYNKKEFEIQHNNYKELIENNKNFLEVFNKKNQPYKSLFYHSDQGMLWASIFLTC